MITFTLFKPKFKPMETLTFSPLTDDNAQQVSRDRVHLATIFYDFDTIVFDQEVKSMNLSDIAKISEEISIKLKIV